MRQKETLVHLHHVFVCYFVGVVSFPNGEGALTQIAANDHIP